MRPVFAGSGLLFSLTFAIAACQAVAPAAPPPAAPVATPTSFAANLPPCGAASSVSQVQLAQVTPTPAPPAPTPAVPPPPPPTPRPAPLTDRVGWPEAYDTAFKQFYVMDRTDARVVSYVCANDIAATVKPDQPFPDGSVLVFETWRPKAEGAALAKDAQGHLIREVLTGVFVMKKGPGLGDEYGALKTGDWAYVAYRPDKTLQTAPANTANCAACHQAAGAGRDWVFRKELFFTPERYAQTPPFGPGEVSISRMAYFPNNLTLKVGDTLKITNSRVDGIPHTLTAADRSFDSGVLQAGVSFSHTFTTPGTFAYTCSLHPEIMRGTIRVE